MRGRVWLIAALAWIGLPALAAAQVKELHWKALDVDAFLDADGALHVSERHEIVFTGDWNGGERVFDVDATQSLKLNGVTRIDPATGRRRPLVEGELDRVDHYRWSNYTLRWRSRLPSDPPFAQTEIVYVLDYVYTGALQSDGDALRLMHNFAFDRPGPIDTLHVRLRVDPSWELEQSFAGEYTHRNLAPQEPFVVVLALALPSEWEQQRMGLFLLLALAPVLLFAALLWFESRRGRLAPLEQVPGDPSWLEQHLLRLPPELVAVLWDGPSAPGSDAVAALLARMELEKKLATRVTHDELQMELLVARDQLDGYERELVEGFFFSGDTTSTAAVQAHYRSSGFNPGRSLTPLVAQAKQLLAPFRPWWVLIGPALILLAIGVIRCVTAPGAGGLRATVVTAISFFVSVFGAVLAVKWRSRLNWGVRQTPIFWALALVPPLGAAVYIWLDVALALSAGLGVALIALAFCAGVIAFACGNESPAGLQLRRRLTAIREELQTRLDDRRSIPDVVVPYLFAFGLAQRAGDWHVAEPAREDDWSSGRSSSSRSSGSSSGSGTFAGGGGAFGGAGASGSWVTAVGALSSGVAAPSSGSSSSTSSSSSSSSGGGRAGGW